MTLPRFLCFILGILGLCSIYSPLKRRIKRWYNDLFGPKIKEEVTEENKKKLQEQYFKKRITFKTNP